jgi:hypothetical protein
VDFPTGHTSGRPFAAAEQQAIVGAALSLLETASAPGEIVDLPMRWADDDSWKDSVLRPSGHEGSGSADQRTPRRSESAWQCEDDRVAAEARHAGGPCGECVGAE